MSSQNYSIFLFSAFIFFTITCEKNTSLTEYDLCEDKVVCLFITDFKSSYFADGRTILPVKASIDLRSDESITHLTFIASDGFGSFSVDGGTDTIIKQLDINRSSETRLMLGNKPGEYKLTAKIYFENKSYEDFFYIRLLPVDKQILKIDYTSDISALQGDGNTKFTGNVSILNYGFDNKNLMCSISGPISFEGSNSSILYTFFDPKGNASINFITGTKAGTATIRYSIDEYFFQSQLMINNSYPNEIKLISKADSIEIGDTLPIHVFLNKYKHGGVSENIPIVIESFQYSGFSKKPIGRLDPPFIYSSSSLPEEINATIRFISSKSEIWNRNLPVYINARIKSDQNSELSDTLIINIK